MYRLNSLDPDVVLSSCDFTANVGKNWYNSWDLGLAHAR